MQTYEVAAPAAGDRSAAKRWLALAALAVAQFMVFLDETVVNVALPSIKNDLGFTQATLAWVVSAYIVVFGGLVLLGGRVADLFGRRRMFLIGTAVFGVASLLDGLAGSQAMLLGARVLQGAGAALATPAALALVTALFPVAAERVKALAIWGALSWSWFCDRDLARRSDHAGRVVAMGILDQRPDRRGVARGHTAPGPGQPSPAGAALTFRARSRSPPG